jgi:alkanesulfonate monooxygenase SsuD/methylene tetrahydromethanopterin reductase-like flavin-dependent oxidoreductase (luciferase family)
MLRDVRFSVVIPSYGRLGEPDNVRDCVLAAERLGYEGAWFADHVALPGYVTSMIAPPMLEPVATCAWVLGFTKRIRVGVDVLVAPYRHPVVVAAMGGTMQRCSNGRFVLGMGVGYLLGEFAALGVDPADRGARTDETLALLRRAWTEPAPLHADGPRFPVDGVFPVGPPLDPDAAEAVPLWVGGNVAAAHRRAALLGDGWHPLFPTPSAYATGRAAIEAARAEGGVDRPFTYSYSGPMGGLLDEPRDWSAVDHTPSPTVAATALRPEFAYAPAPPHTDDGRPLLTGTPDELVRDVNDLAAAGVEHLLLRFWVSASDLDVAGVIDQYERFAELVAPHCGELRTT